MPRIMRDIAYILVMSIILMHLVPLLKMALEPAVRKTMFRGSYIEWIVAPKKGKKIEKALDKFNKMGYNGIVKYNEGFRPIYIYETNKLPDNIMGVAWSLPGYCMIEILDTLDGMKLEDTMIHEYIHCFGYGHDKRRGSVMHDYHYPVLRGFREKTKKQYAKEIYENFYE